MAIDTGSYSPPVAQLGLGFQRPSLPIGMHQNK